MQSVAPLGRHPASYDDPPKKVIEDFYNAIPTGIWIASMPS